MSYAVASRYAKALYAESSQQGSLDECLAGLRQVRDLAEVLPELKAFLVNPLLTHEQQSVVIHALFDKKLPELIITFLMFISLKRRLGLLVDMTGVFEDMYHEGHGQIVMNVVSAHSLDDGFKKLLTERIGRLTGKTVIGEYAIDTSIIGGLRVWAAGKLYEYSFSNELQDYKRKALQNV